MNNTYHFDVELHVNVAVQAGGGFPPESLHAEVHAPTEHLARRRIMDDMLGRGIFIRKITKNESP